jgi:alpha-mannosidase
VSFDGDGHSIPAELWPSSVSAEGVKYRLGPAAGNDALTCHGQKIKVPTGGRVYVLAASCDGDVQATFEVGSKAVSEQVPYFSGFVGQWTSRVVNGKIEPDPAKFTPAYIKRTPVAWAATHRHNKDGRDDAYIYCYLFKLAFDVPKGVRTLTLPNDPRIRVFAVTAVKDPRPGLAAAQEMYD